MRFNQINLRVIFSSEGIDPLRIKIRIVNHRKHYRLLNDGRSFQFQFIMGRPGHSNSVALKEVAQERSGFIGDTHNLVRCLTIKLKVEFRLGPTVLPVREEFQLASPKAALRERAARDSDTYARCLPKDPHLLWSRPSRGDDAAGD